MAIYHLSGTIISRSQGRSAVACAAYRAGEKLVDERYEVTHDYRQKQEVAHQEILAPENVPLWVRNREQLWNGVEAIEKRKDAQLAREFNFALPKELTTQQNIELARAFVKAQFVSKGMVADLCLHNDKDQPHAHVMLTMRALTEEGFGPKVRAWNDKSQLLDWRQAWAETANQHLALHGHDVQIDHRTLEAQGIDLEPQYKIGAGAVSERMARFADHQRIAKENGDRLLANPQIALQALTQQQSTFTHHDIARFVNRHTVDPVQFTEVYELIKSDKQLVYLGLDEKQRERFTTRDMLTLESTMLKQVNVLSQCDAHGVHEHHKTTPLASRTLSSEQTEAFHYLLGAEDIKCLIGYAGTGKSYLLGAAREAWEAQGYRVQGTTLSGIASEVLEGSSGIPSRTLASRCYYWDRGEQRLTEKDILVVDEAGMLGSRQVARLIQEVNDTGAKIVLVGDPEQLQAIEAGAAFRAISEKVLTLELTEVRRQQASWQQEATKAFAQGKPQDALASYQQHDHVHAYQTQALAKEGLVELWNDVRLSNPEQTQIILAYTRQDVLTLNEAARALRKANGELGSDHLCQTERGERQFAISDRLYFLKNDRDLGVMNGSLGTITQIEDKQLTVRLDQTDRTVSLSLDHYPHVEYGYAATIHKSQGVTVDRAYLLSSRYLDRHASYVAMTRHRQSVDVFWSREEFINAKALTDSLSRDRSKELSTDYFAQHRGISVAENASVIERPVSHAIAPNQTLSKQHQENRSSFRVRYEAEHGARARELADQICPAHEKIARLAEKAFQEIEHKMEKEGRTPKLLAEMQKQAIALKQEPEALAHLKRHNPTLSNTIETLQVPVIKSKPLDKEIDRGFER